MTGAGVREVVGVYHADGGLVGELRYVVGRMRGTVHCGLCDVTHSRVRRKASWDAMVERLGVPVRLLHLNAIPPTSPRRCATTARRCCWCGPPTGRSVRICPRRRSTGSVPALEAALRDALGATPE